MTEEHRDTGTGWPEGESPESRVPADSVPQPLVTSAAGAEVAPGDTGIEPRAGAGGKPDAAGEAAGGRAADGGTSVVALTARAVYARLNSPGVTIGLLLALLGFALVVQVQNATTEAGLSGARLQDLVRIQSDLDSRDQRLRQEIATLEGSLRQLSSGAQGRQAALEEATRRADELGILAGTLPARGPGLSLRFSEGAKPLGASVVLDAVQELRGAGAEAMQIAGADGTSVRIIASTYFLDAQDGGLNVDGRRLTGPYTILVIGDPATMHTALSIPGGVVASVKGDGGNVTVEEREVVDVAALSEPIDLHHARPVS